MSSVTSPKKEITFRPMFGFKSSSAVLKIRVPLLEDDALSSRAAPLADLSRDQIIAELRAKIADLEARETKRKAQTRERVRKLRTKDK